MKATSVDYAAFRTLREHYGTEVFNSTEAAFLVAGSPETQAQRRGAGRLARLTLLGTAEILSNEEMRLLPTDWYQLLHE
jgi:hypothetical protein